MRLYKHHQVDNYKKNVAIFYSIFAICIALILFLALHGCATFNKLVTNDALVMQLAVQDATAHVLKAHPDWQNKVVVISQQAIDAIDAKTTITLSAVEAYVTSKINFAGMSPEDQALVSVLLQAVEGSITDSFSKQQITDPASQLIEVRQVLQWINDQAKLKTT